MGVLRLGDAIPLATGSVEWAVSYRPYPGESVCGDWHAIRPVRGGVIAAVIDGLGHGEEAADAGRLASEVISHGGLESLSRIVTQTHEALKRTRGAVMAAAVFAPETTYLEWVGVGNIEGVLARADVTSTPKREYLMSRGGVLGCEPFPQLRPSCLTVRPGDMLVLATDGLTSAFTEAIDPAMAPAVISGRILEHYARNTDDALVMVLRWNPEEVA